VTTFGNTTNESSSRLNWKNVKGGSKFTLPTPGRVTKITALVSNTGTSHAACNVMGLIYADSSKALKGATAAVAVADNQAKGAVDCTFASAVSLTAGDYYLAIFGDGTADGLAFYNNVAGGTSGYNSDTYVGGPADPMGTLTASSVLYAVYATYTPDARNLVAVDVDDTLWQILAGDDATGWRDITDECGGLVYSTVMPGGPGSASFSLPADVWGLGYNEVRADSKLKISYAGKTPWSGFILPRGVNYQGE